MRSSRADLAAFRALDRHERRLLAEAWVLVHLAVLGLRFGGYRRTIGWAGRLGPGRLDPSVDVDRIVDRAVRMTDAAISRSPVSATCLPRSITLWTLLRRRGLVVDVVIGVRSSAAPLDAHAWVELDGRPVGEPAEQLVDYRRFAPGASG